MDKKDEIKKDIKKYSAIEAISKSEGGKIVVSSLQKDITATIDNISRKYSTLPHMELIALSAKLAEQLTLLRVLNRASKLRKLAQDELDFILSEE